MPRAGLDFTRSSPVAKNPLERWPRVQILGEILIPGRQDNSERNTNPAIRSANLIVAPLIFFPKFDKEQRKATRAERKDGYSGFCVANLANAISVHGLGNCTAEALRSRRRGSRK